MCWDFCGRLKSHIDISDMFKAFGCESLNKNKQFWREWDWQRNWNTGIFSLMDFLSMVLVNGKDSNVKCDIVNAH